MLEVRDLSVAYGQHRAMENVSIRVAPGEIAVILGANGAGKSTLLRAVGGLCEGTLSGTIEIDGRSILGQEPHRIVEAGIALVPEGRGVFSDLTVYENLALGAYSNHARHDQQANLDRVLGLFPKLGERRNQTVRTMSGGEQQMVAIGRAMMSNPQILMLDEPSLGLSPLLCRELFHSLSEVRGSGLGILLVEQNAKQSLAIADRGYLLENARIMGEDTAGNLISDPAVQKAYLGVSGDAAPQVVHQPEMDSPASVEASAPSAHPAFSMGEVGRHASAPRVRTDALIGESIDELVSRAADRQEARPRQVVSRPAAPVKAEPKTQTPRPSLPTAGGDRLREVLAEIERAATNARIGNRTLTGAPGTRQRPPEPDVPKTRRDKPEDFDDLPTIEVWRRIPEIEIYRRQPGPDGKGRLVKIQGDDHE